MEKFGSYLDKEVSLYRLENEFLKASVMTMGATLVDFIDKKSGQNIVLNYPDAEGYVKGHTFRGATVGRCANRIGNGTFSLNRQEYHVFVNNGPNSLHGGKEGFAFKIFEVKEYTPSSITLTYYSKDMEENYPGNLQLEVTYRLNGHDLEYIVSGLSDKDTLFNIVNHSYFNLGPDASVEDHLVKIPTDKIAKTDAVSLTLDQCKDVEGSAFDFREFRRLGDNLAIADEDTALADGIDHTFVFENLEMKTVAYLKHNGLMLTVSTDLPDMHVYTTNAIKPRPAICFETGYVPNAINYDCFIKPILKAGEKKTHTTIFSLTEE